MDVRVALAPFDKVAGQDAEFLSERFGEMAEVGEADLASGLFDAHLTIDQQFTGALQSALVIIVVERMPIYLLEEVL